MEGGEKVVAMPMLREAQEEEEEEEELQHQQLEQVPMVGSRGCAGAGHSGRRWTKSSLLLLRQLLRRFARGEVELVCSRSLVGRK